MEAQYSSQGQPMPEHEFFTRAQDKQVEDMLTATSRSVIRSGTTKVPYLKSQPSQEQVLPEQKKSQKIAKGRKTAATKKLKKERSQRSLKRSQLEQSYQKELPVWTKKSEGYLTLSTNSTEGGTRGISNNGIAIVVNCLVKWIKFQSYQTQKSYVEYELIVRGRTKHLINPEFKDGCSEFVVLTRYSELLKLKDKLESAIKSEMQRRGNDLNQFKPIFPKFPPKRVYQKSDHSFIQKRMFAMELYFQEIFDSYGDIVKYTDAFEDFIQPKEKELCILGDQKSGKSLLLWALHRDLYPKKEKKARSDKQTHLEKEDPSKLKLSVQLSDIQDTTGSFFEEQSKTKSIPQMEVAFDPRKAFPLDTIINKQIYRLNIREFEKQKLDVCQVLSYCKQPHCILFFLVNPEIQSSVFFIKPYIQEWLNYEDKKKADLSLNSSCAVLNIISDSSTQRSHQWQAELIQIRNLLHNSTKKGLYAELDVRQRGSTNYILNNVVNQDQKYVIKT